MWQDTVMWLEWISPGMVTGFWFSSRIEVSVHQWFQHPWRSDARKLVWILLIIIFQATSAENVWPQHSKPARSQVSAVLFYTHDVCVGMDRSVQDLYVGFSPASKGLTMLSQSKHWSGGCRVCRTCSTTPDHTVWWETACIRGSPDPSLSCGSGSGLRD